MERIGIYGGTFNPPHLGHIHAAQCAVSALGLDKLLMIPDRIAPHKQLPADSPSPEQRLEMLRLASKQIEKAEYEKNKNFKVYKTMGIISGLGICIILV